MTFTSRERELAAAAISTVHRRNVELVEEYKYVGTIFDNTEEKLNILGVIRRFFGHFIPPSLRVSSLSLVVCNTGYAFRAQSVCSKMPGLQVRALSTVCKQQTLRTAPTLCSQCFSGSPWDTGTAAWLADPNLGSDTGAIHSILTDHCLYS